MVNGDPNTFMFRVPLKIICPAGNVLFICAKIGASNIKQACENAINCYKAWYSDCMVELDE